MYTSKAGRPSSFFVFFWFLPGRDTYVLFSLSTGLFLPDLPLSLSSLSFYNSCAQEKRIMITMMMLGFAGCICKAPDRGCM